MQVSERQLIVLLREGRAPLKARAAVARAALPLHPGPLLESLDILAGDPDPAIREEALASLGKLPEQILLQAVSSPSLPPGLLGRLARRFGANEAVAGAIACNSAADDATVAHLASLPHPAVLGIIGRDRQRLARAPEVLAALQANPASPGGNAPGEHDPPESPAAPPGTSTGELQADDRSQADDPLLVDESAGDDGAAAANARQISIYALLKQMSMGQKVALAVKGNRDVRNILIRDTNKMLCLKVLENPRLADADIEAYAKSTNVAEDVLRGIAMKKEWCKKYPVVKALVFNPKAPLGVTLEYLKRLNLRDLEGLTKNRNVPETLRSAARKTVELRKQSST